MNALDRLVADYDAWLRKQPASLTDLPDTSAEALLHEEITPEQRRWLSDFIARWEAADHDATLDRWNDAALAAMRGQPCPGEDPDSIDGYRHDLEQRKVCVVMPERPEGYYHMAPEDAA